MQRIIVPLRLNERKTVKIYVYAIDKSVIFFYLFAMYTYNAGWK